MKGAVNSIGELVRVQADRYGSKTYLYFKDQEISFGELDVLSTKVANGLASLGIAKGNRVCLMLSNCPEFIYCWFGINKIGAIMVPVNTAYKAGELRYLLGHSQARAIITAPEYLEIIEAVKKHCGHLRHVICAGEQRSRNVVSLGDLVADAPPLIVKSVELGRDDVASIIYTSGTTGMPKGVMLTHQSYILSGEGFVYCRVQASPEDRFLTPLPLFHTNAEAYSTIGTLVLGTPLVLIEKFSASRFWNQVRRYNATVVSCIGSMMRLLYLQPEKSDDADNPARILIGAPAAKDFFGAFEKRFGVKIIEGYSLTECPLGCTNPVNGLRKPQSLGLPWHHPRYPTEVKIVDGLGNEVPRGVKGEIIIRSPAMMKGYFRDPRKTAETIRDGWVYTGDYGYQDKDGYFVFVDRKKEMIRRRGENISATEVESIILHHPKVAEAAVIPVPDQISDEEVMACMVLKPGEILHPAEFIEWCGQNMARFKVPRYVKFFCEFPKTPTYKVQKHILRVDKNLMAGCYERENK